MGSIINQKRSKINGRLYPKDPFQKSTPLFKDITSLLNFVGDGHNGLLGYTQILEASSSTLKLERDLIKRENILLKTTAKQSMEKILSDKETISQPEKQRDNLILKQKKLGKYIISAFLILGILTTTINTSQGNKNERDFFLSENLVGFWNFNEGNGTIAYDYTNYHNGTLTNMDADSCWNSSTPLVNGYALDFDGTDDYVEILDHDELSFGNGSSDSPFSIVAWIKLDQIDHTNKIVRNCN